MPKVSVIIPIYNVEKYLPKCLNSVINQTLSDIEIVCVNDGSTDDSGKVLDKYAKKDKRIKVITQKNQGLAVSRNNGLSKCEGDYVYFLDSDDYIDKHTLKILTDAIINDKSDMAQGHIKCFGKVSTDVLTRKQKGFDWYMKKTGIYTVQPDIRKDLTVVSCNKLYKKSIIDKYDIRFPVGLINEDEYWLWAYMIHCNTYSEIDKDLYFYLQRADSIMGKRLKSIKMLDILDIDGLIYNEVKKYKDIDKYKNILTEQFISRINYLDADVPAEYKKEYLNKIKNYYKKHNQSMEIKKLYKWLADGKDYKSFFATEKQKINREAFYLLGFIPLLSIEEK